MVADTKTEAMEGVEARATRVLRDLGLTSTMCESLQQLMVYQLGTHCPSGEHLRDQLAVREGMEAALRAEVQCALERVVAGKTPTPQDGAADGWDLPIVSLEERAPEPTLHSLPPTSVRALLPSGAACVWQALFALRPGVQAVLACFSELPVNEQDVRASAYVQALCEEIRVMAATLQEAEPVGWSQARDYEELPWVQKLWLDPRRAHLPTEGEFRSEWQWMGWTHAVGEQFAQWLTHQQVPGAEVLAAAARTLEWAEVLLEGDAQAWAEGLGQQFRDHSRAGVLTF